MLKILKKIPGLRYTKISCSYNSIGHYKVHECISFLRGEIGLEGDFFNNFYEFFSKNRSGYNLFILYEHFVYIFKKIL